MPAAERATFDNAYYVSAGQDESATWQEFGEMRFTGPDAVTDAFGPKAIDPLHATGNWATTRYVPWTSWAAAANIWPSASGTVSTEAETSGMAVFAHELSHNLGLPDNYDNPFAVQTAAHRRRHVGHDEPRLVQRPGRPAHALDDPADAGRRPRRAARHPQQAEARLRRRTRDMLRLNRDGLAQSGLAVAEVKAREVTPNGDLAGVHILLDGAGRPEPACRYQHRPALRGPVVHEATGISSRGRFNDYTVEVVQQIGADSFVGGHGVLLGKTKNSSTCGSFSCQPGYIDANPQDINQVDYVKADGTPVKATLGDERQLNDGTFNAGLNSGSTYEYKAAANKLHFYIIDKRTDEQGALRYKVGIRSTGRRRPADAWRPARHARPRHRRGPCDLHVPAQEHGRCGHRAERPPAARPRSSSAATSTACRRPPRARGWTAHLKNALATAKFGETVQVPVYVDKAANASASGSVTLTGDVRERSVEGHVRDLLGRYRRHRRRHRPGDARAEPRHGGQLRSVHAGHAEGLLRHHGGQGHLDRR